MTDFIIQSRTFTTLDQAVSMHMRNGLKYTSTAVNGLPFIKGGSADAGIKQTMAICRKTIRLWLISTGMTETTTVNVLLLMARMSTGLLMAC